MDCPWIVHGGGFALPTECNISSIWVCINRSKPPCGFFGCKGNWVESAGEEKGNSRYFTTKYLFLFLSLQEPPGRNPAHDSPEKAPLLQGQKWLHRLQLHLFHCQLRECQHRWWREWRGVRRATGADVLGDLVPHPSSLEYKEGNFLPLKPVLICFYYSKCVTARARLRDLKWSRLLGKGKIKFEGF